MSRKVDGMIAEYVEDFARQLHKSGYSNINAVEKILRDPGFSTGGSQHRVLWWPRNRRVAKVSRAFHQIDNVSQAVVIIHFRGIMRDDGSVFTKHDLAKYSSVGVRRFNELRKKAKSKLSNILGV